MKKFLAFALLIVVSFLFPRGSVQAQSCTSVGGNNPVTGASFIQTCSPPGCKIGIDCTSCSHTCPSFAIAEFCSDYTDCANCVSVNFSAFDCGNKDRCKWNGSTSCGAPPTPTPTPTCAPVCNSPFCGQSNGCGGTCSTADVGNFGSCSNSCGGGTQTDACGNSQGCCGGGSSVSGVGSWGSCSGSPATKTRTVNHCCTGDTIESTSCTGTINSRAVEISTSDTSCPTITGSSTGANGTVHQFTAGSASQPAAKTQVGATPVTFSGIVGGSYTLAPAPPVNYVLARACWAKSLNVPTSGEGLTTNLSEPTDSDTLTWNVGYTLGTPWVQTQGGDVAAAGIVRSYIPVGIVPRAFALDGAGGYPGIVSYGTDYDFDASSGSKGETLVSSTNWLVNEAPAATDYYQLFYRRFGAPQTNDNALFPNLAAVTQPTSRPTPYYIVGDVTTSGNWSVGSSQTVMVIVDGNLTIGGKINITGTGFVAFIVNGNITVNSSVGGLYSSSTPVVEGVYVTSPTRTFATGASSVAGAERFVGRGTFVAGNFLLQRDLDALKQNPNYSSELFLYNPQLFFTMPDAMRNVPITWQEAAP